MDIPKGVVLGFIAGEVKAEKDISD